MVVERVWPGRGSWHARVTASSLVMVIFYPSDSPYASGKVRAQPLGLDVALEVIRAYRSQRKQDFQAILKYARICRVENVIPSYLEAMQ